jgi:hypothetical protein
MMKNPALQAGNPVVQVWQIHLKIKFFTRFVHKIKSSLHLYNVELKTSSLGRVFQNLYGKFYHMFYQNSMDNQRVWVCNLVPGFS